MNVVVAGSRSISDISLVDLAIRRAGFPISCLISGCAFGVDRLAERLAERNRVPIWRFPADWSLGRGAGFIRNKKMLVVADAAVVIWDGESRGTAHTLRTAFQLEIPLFLFYAV